jgi:hypothetical protein
MLIHVEPATSDSPTWQPPTAAAEEIVTELPE